jgi:hypothetical protein
MRLPWLSLTLIPILCLGPGCSNSSGKKQPKVRIESVTPDEGPVTGGTSVDIVTIGFRDNFTINTPMVSFGQIPATSVTATGPMTVTAITPAGATEGKVPVQVTATFDVQTAIDRGGFTYLASPPVVIATDPVDLATDVPVTQFPGATFDRDMDPVSFGPGSITLDGLGSGVLDAALEYDGATRTVRALPMAPLPLSETVTVTVSGTAQDAGGRAMGTDVTFSFQVTSDPAHILISEVAISDFAQEFIEIYNPTTSTVNLQGYYLADSTWAGGPVPTEYYLVPEVFRVGGPIIGTADDFMAGFPAGAVIGPDEYQTVALAGSSNFESAWGVPPTYELTDDGGLPDAIPDMVPIATGSVGTTARLTNAGELVVLFFWNRTSDLVYDVDYIIWGDAITDPSTPEAADKTGVSLDGPDADTVATPYQNDTDLFSQEVVDLSSHSPGLSYQRLSPPGETGEVTTAGNGLTGHDETSEQLNVASGGWISSSPATPNLPGP